MRVAFGLRFFKIFKSFFTFFKKCNFSNASFHFYLKKEFKKKNQIDYCIHSIELEMEIFLFKFFFIKLVHVRTLFLQRKQCQKK